MWRDRTEVFKKKKQRKKDAVKKTGRETPALIENMLFSNTQTAEAHEFVFFFSSSSSENTTEPNGKRETFAI